MSVSWHVAAAVEYRDKSISEELTKRFEERERPIPDVPRDGAFDAFAAWKNLAGDCTD